MATQTGSLDLKGITSAYSDQQQYFWVESSSSATWGGGAHITNVAESAFKTAAGTWGTNPTAGGYNLLMNTDTANATGSLQLRNGSLPIMNLDNDSLDFNTIDITGGTYRTVASFGETTQIGYDNETKMILSSNSFDMVDSNGTSISHIGNPANQLLLDVFFYDSARTDPNVFVLTEDPTTIEQVTINDVATTNYTLHDLNQVTVNDTLTDGDKISITYKFAGETVYYTFGYRKDGGGTEEDDYFTVGRYSFAAGCYLSATGTASHAEGYNTEAKGHSSHAEGYETIAWEDYAHAEGWGCQAERGASHAEGRNTIAGGTYSHAEGFGSEAQAFVSHAEGTATTARGVSSHAEGSSTYAIGDNSHAEGDFTHANGENSHAQNEGTTAEKFAQTTLGTYNIKDKAGTTSHPNGNDNYGYYALIIGNGTSDTNRSNAFSIDWTGVINCGTYWGQYKDIFDIFYPAGSYYETSLPPENPSGESEPTSEDITNLGVTWFDPHYQWGGSWVLVKDRFLVGAGNLYAVDSEDGSKDAVVVSHHHTTDTYHRHTLSGVKYGSNYCAAGGRSGVGANSDANTTLYTTYAGSKTAASTTVGVDGTDKNMPPYKAVYIWHRIA